jgi:hypothetical protein
LLARFGHVERVPPDPRAWPAQIRGAPRLAAALAEAGPAVLLYRRLALLRRDVPLGGSLEDLRFRGVPRAAFTAFCERLDARRLLERVTRWA